MEELRRLREEAGMSLGDLSEATTYDRSYLSKLERGERLGDFDTARRLDEVYGTRRMLQNLWLLAKDEAYLGRYKQFMRVEAEASVRFEYSASTIPGLLQTEAYAREQLGTGLLSEDKLERDVEARLNRQAVLARAIPLRLRVILDESALRRRLKDPSAWNRQLEHLVKMAELPNIVVQVLPFGAGLQYLLGGSLTILGMPDGVYVAYLEGSTSGELIEEPAEVEQHKLFYDQLRDAALPPAESLEFIRNLIKD
ncbi:XRE family transcriptional regulator [Streptomyces sp. 8K308]|nr:XRE family transcriptional regulator [Streptomyces sp. 8K308]